ncbi:MAG: serine hydrolase domain-containing protein [Planctomycetia bacterium]
METSRGKRIVRALLIALSIVGASGPGAAFAQSESAAALVTPLVDAGHLAGAVVLVTGPDAVVAEEAVGMADREERRPMAADTLFWIASMTKPITAAAVMILVDEGKISLDDPVAKYVPEFQDLWVVSERSGEGQGEKKGLVRPARPITIRDCLSHTSGLPFSSVVERPTLDSVPLATAVRSYSMMPLEFQPGTAYRYSNAGINTAGRIIEIVSGMPYERFLDERLLRPLGMHDTTFWPSGSRIGRIARSYRANADKTALEPVGIGQLAEPYGSAARYPMPGGGLFSTAADCGRFCRMLLDRGVGDDGGRVLSEAAVAELTRRQTPVGVPESYGLGFSLGGDGTFGHGGAHATNMTIDPQRRLAVVWMVQDAGSPPEWRRAEGEVRQWAFERFGAANER